LLFFSRTTHPCTSTLFPSRRSSDLSDGLELPRPPDTPGGVPRALRRQPRRPEHARHRRRGPPIRLARPWLFDRTSWLTRHPAARDRKSTRLNSSHVSISYAVFCLKK